MTPEKKQQIEAAASAERIYEPKYGGKDHSGYNTMMLYEVNDEREECFEKGAIFGYELGRTAEAEKAAALVEAFVNILGDPSDSCPMCDSGKLRNPNKGHWPECKFEIAKQALTNYKY